MTEHVRMLRSILIGDPVCLVIEPNHHVRPDEDPEHIEVRHGGDTLVWLSVADLRRLRDALADMVEELDPSPEWTQPGPDPLLSDPQPKAAGDAPPW